MCYFVILGLLLSLYDIGLLDYNVIELIGFEYYSHADYDVNKKNATWICSKNSLSIWYFMHTNTHAHRSEIN